MQLKDYQQRVLADLAGYLETLAETRDLAQAWRSYWRERGARVGGDGLPDYRNTVPGVPHVCAKVPTAGGKTFLAANALKTVFDALERSRPLRPRLAVWLVPSLTILDQTVAVLADPEHPYRKRLNTLFGGRVAVYEKRDLLMGAGFTRDTAEAQLSIVVMSFDSLRARNKEDRKIFQENGNLASFTVADEGDDWRLPEYDDSALINVIRRLRPVVVVDESHNAGSALSVEMLVNLNPDFILDLTATPRATSNIFSYVDALALKKQHMVKLPVIVANRASRAEAIESALILRRQLEALAQKEEAAGGAYIRPIALFQAQPRTGDDPATFEKIREQLIALGIPAEEIRIKTADVDELKGVKLMERDCPVRYIVTVNALKEGWDCPFAYVLASLADKTSAVDVEQILGRVLRMPYVRQHSEDLLNLSYVFTASSRFMDTLQSVVKGLNRAGFSDRDYRALEEAAPTPAVPRQAELSGFGSFGENGSATEEIEADEQDSAAIDLSGVSLAWQQAEPQVDGTPATPAASTVEVIKEQALAENRAFAERAEASAEGVPAELEDKMNRHRVKEIFRDEVASLRLPQFFVQVPTGGFFADDEASQLFEREALLAEFRLSQCDAQIAFDDLDTEMYRVDLERQGEGDYAPRAFKLDARQRERFSAYILSLARDGQVHNLVARLADLIGNLYPLADNEVKAYIRRVVEAMSDAQLRDCIERDVAYVRKIRQKIERLASVHAEKAFSDWLDVDRLHVEPGFALPGTITPSANASAVPKSLYATEAAMGDFERRVINDVANLESVAWWHRNLSRGKGFRINGFINHYPDFLVKMKSGKLVLLETKGDDRDNSDSERKLKLGKLWQAKAGEGWFYMMVFDHNAIEGAETLADALGKLARL